MSDIVVPPAVVAEVMQVARTILTQLGGKSFLVRTGAEDLTAGRNGRGSLGMKLPRGTRGRFTHVRITLTPHDLYKVETLRITRRNGNVTITTIETRDGINCHKLLEQFRDMTGLPRTAPDSA